MNQAETYEMSERIKKLEEQCNSLESKIDLIMEQVTLGKHIVQFAKLMGWIIGVLATIAELYRATRGH